MLTNYQRKRSERFAMPLSIVPTLGERNLVTFSGYHFHFKINRRYIVNKALFLYL